MKAEIVNPFLHSVINVMSTMATLDPKPGKGSLKASNISRGDVSGIIGMSSDTVAGSMAVSFPKAVILGVVKRMLGDELDEIDDTVTDLVGEITNMISGGAKNMLAEIGVDIGMATPVVVSGVDHEISHKCTGKKIILPFDCEVGEFYVEVCFEG